MILIDVSLFILLTVALVFSIIELGLSADAVSQGTEHGTYFADGAGGFYYGLARGGPSSIASFLLFASLWSCIVSGVLLGLPFVQRRRALSQNASASTAGGASSSSYARQYWLEILTLTLNAVTMIFWLAGFADLANLDDAYGGNPQGVAGALLAFAVLLWLVFLALLVLNILTAVAVLESKTVGYRSLKRGSSTLHPAQPAPVATGDAHPPVMSEVSHEV